MKKLFLTCLISALLLPARAQLFSPEAFSGAAMGAMIGGLAGGSSGGCGYYNGCGNGFSGQGAAIGAGIGLAAGALFSAVNQRDAYYAQPTAYAPQAYYPQPGYGYASPAPVYTAVPSVRPNYAIGGTLVGAASGALIGAGNNQAGVGAGIGAAAGLVAGGIAEYASNRQARNMNASVPQYSEQPQVQPTAPPLSAQGSGSQITSQPVANSTYYWTARVQIPDAPRVPDAPTF